MAAPQGIVRVYHDGETVTFQVEGRVTLTQSLPLRRCAERAVADGAKAVRVDLRRCTYMDSTFLGALLILQRGAERRGHCPLTLVSPSPACCRLFQQMGLQGQLPVVMCEEDPAGACSALAGEADDIPALRCNVVQAHQELAHLPGPAGDAFRAMAPFLQEEAEKRAVETGPAPESSGRLPTSCTHLWRGPVEQPLSSGQANPRPAHWRPGVALALLLGYFALFGVVVGCQGVLWAELKPSLELSDGAFGSALLVSPLVALGLLLQGGRLCAMVGKKRLAVLALALLAVSMPALASARGLWGFVAALAVAGAGSGLLEVVMNAATLDWELATGALVMNMMHAGFSGGAVLGALGTGALLALGWGYGPVLGLLALLCGLALAATLPAGYPPADAGRAESVEPAMTMRLLFSRRALVVLGLLCLLGVAAESVANNWLVLYLGELNAPVAVGSAAFALFNGAMFAGRLANAPLVARLGPRVSLLASGVGLVVAALLLAPAQQAPAVGAFVVMGLAVAGVVPTVLVAATHLRPGDSGAVAGGMMAAGYAGFILCPPLVGWLAELFASLHLAALLCVGLSGLGMLVLVRGVPGERAASGEGG